MQKKKKNEEQKFKKRRNKFKRSTNNSKLFWKNINEIIYNRQIKRTEQYEIKNSNGPTLNDKEVADNYEINQFRFMKKYLKQQLHAFLL